MARLLRSNIQDFVQEVLGQMAQGTPFRCLLGGERGRLNLASVQHATQGSADIYIYIYIYHGLKRGTARRFVIT